MHRLLRRDAVPRVPGAVRRRRGHARWGVAAAQDRSTRGRSGPSSAGPRGLAYVLVGEDGELGGPVAKNLSEAERDGLAARVGAVPGDCVFFAAGEAGPSRALLGAARLEIGRRVGLIDESAWSFVWIVDAPMFEPSSNATASGDVAVGTGPGPRCTTPFTSPKPEWIDTFEDRPGRGARLRLRPRVQRQRDRWRLHPYPPQRRAAARVRHDRSRSPRSSRRSSASCSTRSRSARRRTAASPSGWDRICVLLSGTDSIRDVIAFPKTGGGQDPLTGAPGTDHGGAAQGGRHRLRARPCGRPHRARCRAGRGVAHRSRAGSGQRTGAVARARR